MCCHLLEIHGRACRRQDILRKYNVEIAEMFCFYFRLRCFCFSSFAHSHAYSITFNSPTMTWHFHTWAKLVTRLNFVVGSRQCKVRFMPSPTDSDISILTYISSNKCIDMFKLALHVWKGLYLSDRCDAVWLIKYYYPKIYIYAWGKFQHKS